MRRSSSGLVGRSSSGLVERSSSGLVGTSFSGLVGRSSSGLVRRSSSGIVGCFKNQNQCSVLPATKLKLLTFIIIILLPSDHPWVPAA